MQTLSEIRALLAERGLRPRHRLGQNFLHDKNQITRLVDAADVGSGDLVLEVGPGTGALTEALLERGAEIVACEIDRDLAGILRDRLGDRISLVEGDCLAVGRVELMFTRSEVRDREEARALLARAQVEIPTMDYRDGSRSNLGVTGESTVRSRQHRIRQWAGAEHVTLAVVFTDLIASVALTDAIGNEAMEDVRRIHFDAVRRAVNDHAGYEIKTNGDSFMVGFHTAVNAVGFALDLQAAPGDDRLRVRAAAHIGPVVVAEDDVQGAAVCYAARILDHARKGGVWVSREVKGHLDQEKAAWQRVLTWRHHPQRELRGFPGQHDLWSVNEDL